MRRRPVWHARQAGPHTPEVVSFPDHRAQSIGQRRARWSGYVARHGIFLCVASSELPASLEREAGQVGDYPRHAPVCKVRAKTLRPVDGPDEHREPALPGFGEQSGAWHPPAAPAERCEPLMDGEGVRPASLGEIEGKRLKALGPTSEAPRTEEEAAVGVWVQVPDGTDHRLVEGRVQQLVTGEAPRRLLDHLSLEAGLLDLDIDSDAAGAEVEHRVEGGGLGGGAWRLRRTSAA